MVSPNVTVVYVPLSTQDELVVAAKAIVDGVYFASPRCTHLPGPERHNDFTVKYLKYNPETFPGDETVVETIRAHHPGFPPGANLTEHLETWLTDTKRET